MAAAMVLSMLFHVGIVAVAPRNMPTPPAVERPVQRPVPVSIRKERISLLEAETAAAARPEPKPAEAAPKVPERPAETRRPAQPRPETPPPAPRPPAEKPAQPPPPEPTPTQQAAPAANSRPAPFVLRNVSLRGGVAVQTGENSNLFGDPSVDARGFRGGVDAPRTAGGQDSTAGNAGTEPVRERLVVTEPRALNEVRGEYPAEYKDLRRIVRVVVVLTVGADGNVKAVRIKKGAEDAFNEAARRAARELRFEPATRNGTPIEFPKEWEFIFIPEGT